MVRDHLPDLRRALLHRDAHAEDRQRMDRARRPGADARRVGQPADDAGPRPRSEAVDGRLEADARCRRGGGQAAAKTKDVEAISALSDQLLESCTTCHRHYRPGYGQKPKPPMARAAALRRSRSRDWRREPGAGAEAAAIVLFTSTEQIPLKAYAEIHALRHPAAVERVGERHSDRHPDFRYLRCGLTGWSPKGVLVASEELFKTEHAERRLLPIVTRPVGVSAVAARDRRSRKPEKIAELCSAVGVPEGGDDAYFFFMLSARRDDALLPVQDRGSPK